jgi:pilus assembly protein CpaC
VISAPLASDAAATTPLSLRTGQSVVIPAAGLSRVAVGDGRIAGVVPIGNAEIVVNGKSAGRTTLFVWSKGVRRTYDVTVNEQDLENMRKMLKVSIADPNVHLNGFEHSIVVDGTVATGEQLVHLGEVISRFDTLASANKYTIVNTVTVARPLGPLQSQLASDPSTSAVRVDRDLKGNLIVSGQVPNRTTAEHVLAQVRTLAGPYLAVDGKVIDRLESATVSQVDVKVYVLEVDETALRQLGINLQSATFQPGGQTFTTGAAQFPVVETPPGVGKALTIGAFFRSVTLAPTLNLILTSGHAKLLSSPDLVTLPGREATFLVGGQIPIPYAKTNGTIAMMKASDVMTIGRKRVSAASIAAPAMSRPRALSWLANSTIKIPFLLARPISITKPTWT